MNSENRFYEELSVVPEMPSGIYTGIERKISRRSAVKRSIMALAASLILALGYLGYTVNKPAEKTFDTLAENSVLQSDIADELQIVSDYLNGNDLEQEFDNYALVNGY